QQRAAASNRLVRSQQPSQGQGGGAGRERYRRRRHRRDRGRYRHSVLAGGSLSAQGIRRNAAQGGRDGAHGRGALPSTGDRVAVSPYRRWSREGRIFPVAGRESARCPSAARARPLSGRSSRSQTSSSASASASISASWWYGVGVMRSRSVPLGPGG